MSTETDRIESTDGWGNDFDVAHTQDDTATIKALLVGRSVRKVAADHLRLDDGTLLKFVGHDGGCACSAGCYDLTELNDAPNIITNVEFEDAPGGDGVPCRTCGKDWCYDDDHDTGDEGRYRIFVYAENQKINLATFEGSDGNGYYGTGYYVLVRRPATTE